MQNIVEYLRYLAIESLFSTAGFRNSWPTWLNEIQTISPTYNNHSIFDLGDSLKDIFYTTNTSSDRSQSDVSGGGANWEGIVCWYLNLCLIGRRTVVIKHKKSLIPEPVRDAITVKYGTFPSNTESDLIAITFPDKSEYACDKDDISISDSNGNSIPTYKSKKSKYNLNGIITRLSDRDFSEIEIHIIQCKTNWNDNAQIPMLWDAVYSAGSFNNNRISVGQNGYSINSCKRFTYSFVTVPTVSLDKIKSSSTCVLRVQNLTGGNYWGLATQNGVSSSVKEMLSRNLGAGHRNGILDTLQREIPKLNTDYSYFRL